MDLEDKKKTKKSRKKKENEKLKEEEILEKQRQDQLIGQLKAAEARKRLRDAKLKAKEMQQKELEQLIMCQPTALRAVRLEALLSTDTETKASPDSLTILQRRRIQQLMSERANIPIARTH
ncbi:hypothetical protein SNEBB_003134 [Seison nebaliae]|nr:hypothetical protein SNEBB_003134 [Seison nebaliae]